MEAVRKEPDVLTSELDLIYKRGVKIMAQLTQRAELSSRNRIASGCVSVSDAGNAGGQMKMRRAEEGQRTGLRRSREGPRSEAETRRCPRATACWLQCSRHVFIDPAQRKF